MIVADTYAAKNLERVYNSLPSVLVGDDSRFVIFSDLHIGNGGTKDDILANESLFSTVLEQYYLQKGYTLVLNGDVEELQRFSYRKVVSAHPGFYSLMEKFQNKTGLYKTVGNHDAKLFEMSSEDLHIPIEEGLRMKTEHGDLLVFHGHQASYYFGRYNRVAEIFLRAFVNPLGIKNFATSESSTKRFTTERRVYFFSKERRVVSIIGHTHRPLFESLSKWDALRYAIESNLRKYLSASEEKKTRYAHRIKVLKAELDAYLMGDPEDSLASQVYDSVVVPSVFNSGCVLGKRGMTGIEISGGKIRLVYWFDEKKSSRYINDEKRPAKRLAGTGYHRKILKQDLLAYVFARINLLT